MMSRPWSLPSLHHIRDAGIRSALELTVRELDQLRRRFKALLSSGENRPCGCGNPACPTFMLTDAAAREMDRARDRVLAAFRRPYPSFNVVLESRCQSGSRSMNELLSASARAKAKVVLVGDSQQLQPISASPSLKILMSVIEPNRIDKIIRQREQWARDAAPSFAEGDAAAGLASYADRGLLQSCAGAKVIVTRAVDQYLAAKRSAPQQEHLLIAKSNKVVRALNAEIRRRMRADNVLVGPDYTIKAGDSSGRAFGLNLAVAKNPESSMIYGYARMSSERPTPQLQLTDLKAAGCDRIFREKIRRDCPQLIPVRRTIWSPSAYFP
jgi:hypothetical protein